MSLVLEIIAGARVYDSAIRHLNVLLLKCAGARVIQMLKIYVHHSHMPKA